MDYYKLLDFKNQKIVDEVYRRVKNENASIELEEAYNKIKERNNNAIDNSFLLFRKVKYFILSLIEMIRSFLFVPLFIVTGSFVLSCVFLIFIYANKEEMQDLIDFFSNIGINVYDSVFGNSSEIISDIMSSNSDIFLIIGITTILVFIFLIIFLISLFKKNKKEKIEFNKDIKLGLEKSKRYLQVNDDDTWEYIKNSFQKKLSNNKNKANFNNYYSSYILLFYNYQSIEGEISDLTQKQKKNLYIRTITNSFNNILGSFSKPIFIIITIIIAYTIYGEGIRLLTTIENPLQSLFLSWNSLLVMCDNIISKTPLCIISNIFSTEVQYNYIPKTLIDNIINYNGLEIKIYVSFGLLVSLILFIYSICTKKIIEIKRQYNRRLNYYLKINKGIYKENEKFSNDYLYTIEFVMFVAFILIYILFVMIDK